MRKLIQFAPFPGRFPAPFQSLACVIAMLTMVATSSANAEVRIVAIGDSSINGHGVSRSVAYPAQLEAALKARGHQVSVSNEGIDGDTTAGVLGRLDNGVPQGTDIVVLAIGGNDIVLHHLTPAFVAAQVKEIRNRVLAKGAQFYRIEKMQQGIVDRLDLHVEQVHNPANTMWHLNGAGYAVVLSRTLPAIEAMVKKAEKRAN